MSEAYVVLVNRALEAVIRVITGRPRTAFAPTPSGTTLASFPDRSPALGRERSSTSGRRLWNRLTCEIPSPAPG